LYERKKKILPNIEGTGRICWFTLEQAEVATGKGGWYPAPEPERKEEEQEIEIFEIEIEGQPEKPKRGRKPKQ
jgi:hypothetical protein